MEFKPSEIVLIILGVAAPTIFLVLAFIPGGLNFIGDFALDPRFMPWIFFGGAGLLFCVLAYRIYRRIRPLPKKQDEEAVHVSPTRMPKVDGAAALRKSPPPAP
jgi:hypothetical protein